MMHQTNNKQMRRFKGLDLIVKNQFKDNIGAKKLPLLPHSNKDKVGVFFYIMFLMFSKSPSINLPKEDVCLIYCFQCSNVELARSDVEQQGSNVEQFRLDVEQLAHDVEQSGSDVEQFSPNVEQSGSDVEQLRTMLNNLANLFEVKLSSEPFKQ